MRLSPPLSVKLILLILKDKEVLSLSGSTTSSCVEDRAID